MTEWTFENVVSLRDAVLMAILTVHGVKVNSLIQTKLHPTLNNRLHTFDIRRIVDSNVVYMPPSA